MFAKNLTFYRLRKGLTKKELAARCGITPMAVTNYEAGRRMPDMSVINRVAEVLEVRVIDILEPRNTSLQFRHGAFRKSARLPLARQEYVRAYVESYCSRFADTLEILGGSPIPPPPAVRALKPTGDFRVDAGLLRASLGFAPTGPLEGLVGVLEARGMLVLEIPMEDAFSGMNGMVGRYPYLVVNGTMSPERKRMTLCHELVHCLFAETDVMTERYVNQVAGAFLLPDADVVACLGLKRDAVTKDYSLVCATYGVSMYLLVLRARQAGVVSSSTATGFFVRANKAGWRTNEPSRIGDDPPLLFRRLVLRAVNDRLITLKKGAELLRVPVSAVRSYCGEVGVAP